MSHLKDFQNEDYVRAAVKRLGTVPDNFMIYRAGWVGDLDSDARIMRLDGCVFREAKRGARAGQLCIAVPGTRRTVHLTVEEIQAAK